MVIVLLFCYICHFCGDCSIVSIQLSLTISVLYIWYSCTQIPSLVLLVQISVLSAQLAQCTVYVIRCGIPLVRPELLFSPCYTVNETSISFQFTNYRHAECVSWWFWWRFGPSALWRCVDWQTVSDDSNELAASVIAVCRTDGLNYSWNL